MVTGDPIYRKRFAERYLQLFYEAWKQCRFHPAEGARWLRTLTTQKKMAARRQDAEKDQVMIPPVMIFSVTSHCNLNCKGCYSRGRMNQGEEELSLERINQLFGEASDLGIGVIMLAGGEPLMRPEILWTASAYRNIVFPVFTNGTLLNQGSISYFKRKRNLIPILSMEGDSGFTDQRRGEGVHSRIIQAMGELKRNRCFFGLSLTLTRTNFEQVTRHEWFWRHSKMGSRLFFLVEYVPQSESEQHLCLTGQQKRELRERLAMARTRIPAHFVSLPGDESQYGGCLAAGRGFIHISADGSLEPCPFAPYSDMNIRERSLKEALRSDFLGRIRGSHHLLSEAKGGCSLWENRNWVQAQLVAT